MCKHYRLPKYAASRHNPTSRQTCMPRAATLTGIQLVGGYLAPQQLLPTSTIRKVSKLVLPTGEVVLLVLMVSKLVHHTKQADLPY